jgi:hypothetical protein
LFVNQSIHAQMANVEILRAVETSNAQLSISSSQLCITTLTSPTTLSPMHINSSAHNSSVTSRDKDNDENDGDDDDDDDDDDSDSDSDD